MDYDNTLRLPQTFMQKIDPNTFDFPHLKRMTYSERDGGDFLQLYVQVYFDLPADTNARNFMRPHIFSILDRPTDFEDAVLVKEAVDAFNKDPITNWKKLIHETTTDRIASINDTIGTLMQEREIVSEFRATIAAKPHEMPES